MSPSGDGEEELDEPRRPLLPPDDRLWRHPSEMASLPVPGRPAGGSSATGAGPGPGSRATAGRPRPGDPSTKESRARARKASLVSLVSGLMVGAALTAMILALVGSPARPTSRITQASDDATASGTGTAGSGPVSPGAGASPASTALAAVGPALTSLDDQVVRSVVTVEALRGGVEQTGLGIEMDHPGAVMTTDSLIDGAEAVSVVEPSGQTLMASTVGVDPVTDIGVLEVDSVSWSPIPVSNRSLQSQELVTAITRSSALPHYRGPDIYMGEVTATSVDTDVPDGPPVLDGIATDVALPPGTDGAPLIDRSGQLVGMVALSGPGGSTLAIPVSTALPAMASLLTTGSVPHGWIGVERVQPAPRGVVVEEIDPTGPAARAGVRKGDMVTAVDGTPVRTMDDLSAEVQLRRPGTRVSLDVWRAGGPHTVRIVLGALPGQ